nr:MAG TPA: hypothetical protein [Caudoviricetes sp.]
MGWVYHEKEYSFYRKKHHCRLIFLTPSRLASGTCYSLALAQL